MPPPSLQVQLAASQAALAARDRAMQTPSVVRRAMLRGESRTGTMRFPRMVMGALWLLEELGNSFATKSAKAGRSPLAELMEAALVLSNPERARDAIEDGASALAHLVYQFARAERAGSVAEIERAVVATMKTAFATIPGKGAQASGELGPEKNTGVGWTLTVVERTLAEYPWPLYVDYAGVARTPLDYVVWRVPCEQIFCLTAASFAREGREPRGPTYIEAEMCEARWAAIEPGGTPST